MESTPLRTPLHTPLISIAMCTYNGGNFLREQLDSIITQTFTGWELIIVDDCSSDDTQQILNLYALQDPRISINYNEQNLGYNKNFEKALQLCKSDIIAICDQDDVWRSDKLEVQFAAMKDHLLVYHDSELTEESGKKMSIKISDKFNFYRGSQPEVFLYMNCVSGHSIMLRKQVVENALPFPADFHYDQWLAFNAANHGSIDFVDECLVSYRQHRKNNTDLLALHTIAKNTDQKIGQLLKESEWLALCLRKATGPTYERIRKLSLLCDERNKSFVNIAYGFTIWQNKDTLLYLLRKTTLSKFFYTLRKIWGYKAKMISR